MGEGKGGGEGEREARRNTMTRKHNALAAIILLGALVLGCAAGGGYGRIRLEESGPMTVESLINNWQNYNIYYAGDGTLAVAVLFDPKNDGKTLNVGPRWVPVSDQESLRRMINLMSQKPGTSGFLARLWAVVSPDGSTYGYTYTLLSDMVVKVIDDKTLLVESLS